MEAQMGYVRGRMIDFFSQSAQIAKDYPPPAINAGNGWMRNRMIDGNLTAFGKPSEMELDGDAEILFTAYLHFYDKSLEAFRLRDNFANSFLDQVQIVFKVAFNDITRVIKDILVTTRLTPTEIGVLVSDFRKIVDDIKGVERNGRHLNGWIAVDLKKAAQETILMLDVIESSSQAYPVTIVFKTAMQKLAELSKGDPEADGSLPWLRSEWQVQYLAVMSSAAVGLLNL